MKKVVSVSLDTTIIDKVNKYRAQWLKDGKSVSFSDACDYFINRGITKR